MLTGDTIRPYYMPREFSHVITINVYISPSPDAAAVSDVIHTVVPQLQTSHPQSLLLISGDFNHPSLFFTLPTFTQYVKFSTRENKTLVLLHANVMDAYSSPPPAGPLWPQPGSSPPAYRKDFNHVDLKVVFPKFHQHVNCATCGKGLLDKVYLCYRLTPPSGRDSATSIIVKTWPNGASSQLQDCFANKDWNIF